MKKVLTFVTLFLMLGGVASAEYCTEKDEKYAKENKLGLWAMSFEFPWDFRKTNK